MPTGISSFFLVFSFSVFFCAFSKVLLCFFFLQVFTLSNSIEAEGVQRLLRACAENIPNCGTHGAAGVRAQGTNREASALPEQDHSAKH
ncbi:uncharacterized protein YALI1_E09522g [Yarrowia lipolytica]|uniref:Uncharacterized protein n=1 Tax=Yarrowia lipolytica TaxID=4952 RepID=A0A1D8NHJ9_YARLL|nr:hypothetical protein YALI1_E09522g [Yarrowia lipolytica]